MRNGNIAKAVKDASDADEGSYRTYEEWKLPYFYLSSPQ